MLGQYRDRCPRAERQPPDFLAPMLRRQSTDPDRFGEVVAHGFEFAAPDAVHEAPSRLSSFGHRGKMDGQQKTRHGAGLWW